MEPRIQYVTSADGVRIAHAAIGEGYPVVIPANAWGDIRLHTSAALTGIVNGLVQAGRQAILYDGRGSGDSDRNIEDMSLPARLSDLEAVVDRHGLAQFDMMGVIHGCATSVAYAAKHPDRVSHAVLTGPYARGREYYAGTPMMRAIRALSEMAEENWEFFTMTLASWFLRFQDPERTRAVAEIYQKGMNPRDYMNLVAACESTDITDLLPQVTVPTLVIRDASSVFTTIPEFTRDVAAAIPGAELVTVENVSFIPAVVARFIGMAPPVSAESPAFRTVLFTDLVGHTEMMRRLGDDKGRDVLREHETITRNVLKTHGGIEVKTMGDGFLASFPSVTRAVECALALQSAFSERNETAHESLHVRVGLNAGEPIEEDGDLFGETVILASRIAAMAGGGEIFASTAVRELCAGKGFLFADIGEQTMRGFEDPVRVFEIKRPG